MLPAAHTLALARCVLAQDSNAAASEVPGALALTQSPRILRSPASALPTALRLALEAGAGALLALLLALLPPPLLARCADGTLAGALGVHALALLQAAGALRTAVTALAAAPCGAPPPSPRPRTPLTRCASSPPLRCMYCLRW